MSPEEILGEFWFGASGQRNLLIWGVELILTSLSHTPPIKRKPGLLAKT